MPSPTFDQITQFIRQAGQKAKHLRTLKFQVIEKETDDYVTSVDRTLDQIFTHQFQTWFPHDSIVTEENPDSFKLWQQEQSRFWLIDPIDGTSDFIAGQEFYAVMVGLLDAGVPIMGWIYAPESDRMFYGGTAIGGLWTADGDRPPTPITISTFLKANQDSLPIILSAKDESNYGEAIRAAIPTASFYSLGSFGLKVMEVVLGRAAMYLYLNRRVKLWDTAGPLAIAQAAGLVCCDLQGHPISFEQAAIETASLTHYQPILIGWAEYVNKFQPQLAKYLLTSDKFK